MRLSYQTKDYAGNGTEISKDAIIYLPCGYETSDSDTRYNIFYLMHGAGGSESTYLGDETSSTRFKNVLDNMIANGDIEPLIVVCPTIAEGDDFYESTNPVFPQELANDLIPAAESTYHTYASDITPEGRRPHEVTVPLEDFLLEAQPPGLNSWKIWIIFRISCP